jgi:hypothetical protein
MRDHVLSVFAGFLGFCLLSPFSLGEEAAPRSRAYHVYDQRATVVDMESLMKQKQPEARKTPDPSQDLKDVLREEYTREKQYGFKQVELLPNFQSYVPDTEEVDPDEKPSSWLKPSDLADEENALEELPDNPDLESKEVDQVVEWDKLEESLAEEALKVPESVPGTEEGLEEDEQSPYGRNTSAVPENGLKLESAMNFSDGQILSATEKRALLAEDREDRRMMKDSAMVLDRVPFESAEARALSESFGRDDLTRTQTAMQEITSPWQANTDLPSGLSSPPGAGSWEPARALDRPLVDVSVNPAVRSVTSLQAVEAPRPLPSMEISRIPTVLDPLSRNSGFSAQPPPMEVERPVFRQDEFRISPGMGDGFPMGNFR